MSLVRLLLRNARWVALVAVAAGLVAGAAGVGLIALIQGALARDRFDGKSLAWQFAALCPAALVARVASHALLIRLAQRSVHDLYVSLSRSIIALPLRQLETI